ncbi:hypothetical protein MRX96_048380 [Rhipicephalus microplus]
MSARQPRAEPPEQVERPAYARHSLEGRPHHFQHRQQRRLAFRWRPLFFFGSVVSLSSSAALDEDLRKRRYTQLCEEEPVTRWDRANPLGLRRRRMRRRKKMLGRKSIAPEIAGARASGVACWGRPWGRWMHHRALGLWVNSFDRLGRRFTRAYRLRDGAQLERHAMV